MIEYPTEMEPKPTDLAAPDDARLIEKIVRGRDRDAFAELVKRFEQPAFYLALHITGCRALSEEVVQDAMIAIWRGAESFRPDGDVRRWTLGIVANSALRASRKERKSQRAKVYERERKRAEPEQKRPEENASRSEVLGALRGQLSRLPDVERKLVALYYGAGMTQEEIGAALNLSQRTVSFKLQACLEHLRKSLARAGLTAAAPILTPQVWYSVFKSGPGASSGLAERILTRCDSGYAPHGNSERSERAAAVHGSPKAVAISAILVLALAATVLLLWGRAPASNDKVFVVTPTDQTASLAAEPHTPLAELRAWTFKFDKPIPDGFEYTQGDWRQGTFGPQNHTGLIAGRATLYNALLLPKLEYRLPLKATIRFQRLSMFPINVGLGWSDYKQTFGARKWRGQATAVAQGRDSEFSCYFMAPYTVSVVGDQVGTVCRDIEPVDRSRMFFTGGNIAIESIEIREVREAEIPEDIRNVEALLRTLTEDSKGIQGRHWSEHQVRPLARYLKEQGNPEKTD